MSYLAADDRYDAMPYRRCGRSGLQLPGDLARPVAQLRRRRARSRRSARSCAARSTSASPTSTSPTTTARRPARAESNFGRILREDLAPYRDELIISTKAGYDMWPGPVRRVGLAQVPARQPRPEPRAHGPRLRRHLLLAPPRPRHAARGDARRASTPPSARARRCTPASRPTRPRARPRRADPARARHAAADPPAVLLAAQPLDRGGPARRARARRASAASSSRRSPRACSPTSTSTASPSGSRAAEGTLPQAGLAHRGEPRARARAERDRRSGAASRSPRWRSPGCCATRA